MSTSGNISPEDWLKIALAKSGAPCSWAAWAGALAGGAKEETLNAYREYGLHCGVLLQVADDFNGIWSTRDGKDLRSRQLNLAICYARLVTEGDQRTQMERLLEASRRGDCTAERQTQQLLVTIGAQAYLLIIGSQQHRQALAALCRHGQPAQPLVDFLDRIWPAVGEIEENGRPSEKI